MATDARRMNHHPAVDTPKDAARHKNTIKTRQTPQKTRQKIDKNQGGHAPKNSDFSYIIRIFRYPPSRQSTARLFADFRETRTLRDRVQLSLWHRKTPKTVPGGVGILASRAWPVGCERVLMREVAEINFPH